MELPASDYRCPPAKLRGLLHYVTPPPMSEDDPKKLQSVMDRYTTGESIHASDAGCRTHFTCSKAQVGSAYNNVLGWVSRLAFSPDSQKIAYVCSHPTCVGFIDVSSGLSHEIAYFYPGSVAFSPDSQMIAFDRDKRCVQIWDIKNNCVHKDFGPHTANVSRIALSPDGEMLACGADDGRLTIWKLGDNEQCHAVWENESDEGFGGLSFSPSGKLAFSERGADKVYIWNFEDISAELVQLKGHIYDVNTVAFSPNGQYIASGSDDSTVRIWDVEQRRSIQTLTGHTGGVRSVAFSPDGTKVASGSRDATVRVWKVESGESAKAFEGHEDWVNCVAFSGDGTRVASGSDDGTIRLWDATLEGDWSQLVLPTVNDG